MTKSILRIKKGEERRAKSGHPWLFSNEIDTKLTPLKFFTPGQEVIVQSYNQTFLGVAYINPHSLIAARIFSHEPKATLNEEFISEKIKLALQLRERLFDLPFYRLIYSDADQLPGLIIDRFDNDFVVQINTLGMENHKENISNALRKSFSDINSILFRNDSNSRLAENLTTYIETGFGEAPTERQLIENNTKFIFPYLNGQKTGWFYDHRMNRERLIHYTNDQTVLDVCSYVGAWGIQAASKNAKHVDFIETSKLATDFIQRNAELNSVSGKITIINEDAFDALKALHKDKKTYDVIVIDPPAFVKKIRDKKEGLIAYQRLNEMAVKLLNPQGILFSCSCSMHVQATDLLNIIKRVAYNTGSQLQLIECGAQGPDHPIHLAIAETAYLKCLVVRKLARGGV